jgi:hypothetical protein
LNFSHDEVIVLGKQMILRQMYFFATGALSDYELASPKIEQYLILTVRYRQSNTSQQPFTRKMLAYAKRAVCKEGKVRVER